MAVLLLGGLAYAVYLAIAGIGDEASANAGRGHRRDRALDGGPGAAHRDEIAAEPMLTVPESAAFPAETTSAEGARRSRSRPGPGSTAPRS